MNKVYDIITPSTTGQTHCVVAKNMATAERIYLAQYPYTQILEIRLHSEYVLVEKEARDE